MTITALAYQSDWTETCRGCVVGGGSSDFQFKASESADEIIEFIATCMFNAKNQGGGYDFTILFNGKEAYEWEEHEQERNIIDVARTSFDKKWEEWQAHLKAQAEAKQKAALQAQEKKEREQLALLQAKYGEKHE